MNCAAPCCGLNWAGQCGPCGAPRPCSSSALVGEFDAHPDPHGTVLPAPCCAFGAVAAAEPSTATVRGGTTVRIPSRWSRPRPSPPASRCPTPTSRPCEVLDALKRGDVSSARRPAADRRPPRPQDRHLAVRRRRRVHPQLLRDRTGPPRPGRLAPRARRGARRAAWQASGLSAKQSSTGSPAPSRRPPRRPWPPPAPTATGEHDAAHLIRRTWREKSFEADVQRLMLSRFAQMLSAEDHARAPT